jgi:hypothetical protein
MPPAHVSRKLKPGPAKPKRIMKKGNNENTAPATPGSSSLSQRCGKLERKLKIAQGMWYKSPCNQVG